MSTATSSLTTILEWKRVSDITNPKDLFKKPVLGLTKADLSGKRGLKVVTLDRIDESGPVFTSASVDLLDILTLKKGESIEFYATVDLSTLPTK